MKTSRIQPVLIGSIAAMILALQPTSQAALSLIGTSYDQNFDSIGTGLPSDWTVRTGATATALGTAQTLTTTATSWGDTGAVFKNVASATGLASNASTAAQAASLDRALGIRQGGSFGDSGASFTLEIGNTTGLAGFGLSLDLEMLSVQTRSTTWSIQYGIGATPASFSTLYTYADPGAFGTTSTGLISLGSVLDNLASPVWLRIVALTASSGSGSRDTIGIDSFHLQWTSAAADLYFDTNGSTAGIGGAGTWDTTTANWNTLGDGTGSPQAITSASKAIFGGTGGAVIVDAGGVTASGGIQFDADGYMLSGGTLSLGNPSIVTNHASGITTISSVVAGSAGLQKLGVGTMELTASNTFTGTVLVGAGILKVSADANLGATSNAVQLAGGKLVTTGSITLDAGRSLTGSGAVEVASGQTLTVPGTVNASSLTLDGGGNLALTGTTPVISALTVSGASTITSTNTITNGGITTTHTAGTVSIAANLDLGATSRTFTVSDGSASVDLVLSGNLTMTGTGNRITKFGDGTLELTGTNSISGLRVGAAGNTPTNGGRVIIHDADDLGTNQMQFNAGTLEIQGGALTTTVGVSLGGGQLAGGATFQGSPITFQGSSSLFKAALTPAAGYQHKITANTDVTFAGGLNLSTSSGISTGFTIAGTGTVSLPAAANTITENITVDGAKLEVTGNLTGTTVPTISIINLAVLSGSSSGVGLGGVSASAGGIVAPGTLADATATLNVGNLDIQSTGTLSLEIGGTAAGDFDQLSVTGTLTLGGALSVSLLNAYVPSGVDAFTVILNDGTGATDPTTTTFAGLPEGAAVGATGLYITYAGGDGNDVVLTAVPEPGSAALLLGGIAMLGARRRRRS